MSLRTARRPYGRQKLFGPVSKSRCTDHQGLREADQRLADLVAEAHDDVDHARWELVEPVLGQVQGGERSHLRRLDHARIAGSFLGFGLQGTIAAQAPG